MRVLVIGGTGFIGPHVVRRLVGHGHQVAVLHRGTRPLAGPVANGPEGREPLVEIHGDRNQLAAHREAIALFAPDVVVDLILSSGRPAAALMDVMAGVARRVVAASSMDVYRACGVLHGSEPGGIEPLPLTEASPLRTVLRTYPPDRIRLLQSVFAWVDDEYDKIPVEQAVLGHPRLPGTVLRLPMVYGPGDPLHRFRGWLRRMDDGRPAILFAEDYARWRGTKGYVEDVAAAIALAATDDRAAGRVFNVGEADALTEREWAGRLASVAGWGGRLVALPRQETPPHLVLPGNTAQHWVASSDRIRRELGYRESVPRDEALRRTVAWERAQASEGSSAGPEGQAAEYAAEDEALARASA